MVESPRTAFVVCAFHGLRTWAKVMPQQAAPFSGGYSAARSVFVPSFDAPPAPLFRAPLSSPLSLPNAPFAAQAARHNEIPSDVSEGIGTVVPRFASRFTATAPFTSPVSTFVNRSAPSGDGESPAFRSPNEPGGTAAQLFSTRGAAYEMARTLRSGTLDDSLARTADSRRTRVFRPAGRRRWRRSGGRRTAPCGGR